MNAPLMDKSKLRALIAKELVDVEQKGTGYVSAQILALTDSYYLGLIGPDEDENQEFVTDVGQNRIIGRNQVRSELRNRIGGK